MIYFGRKYVDGAKYPMKIEFEREDDQFDGTVVNRDTIPAEHFEEHFVLGTVVEPPKKSADAAVRNHDPRDQRETNSPQRRSDTAAFANARHNRGERGENKGDNPDAGTRGVVADNALAHGNGTAGTGGAFPERENSARTGGVVLTRAPGRTGGVLARAGGPSARDRDPRDAVRPDSRAGGRAGGNERRGGDHGGGPMRGFRQTVFHTGR